MGNNYVASFVKDNRSRQGLTQEQLATKAGVGLRFIRELEQGKSTLRTDKINQVLSLFGYALVPGKELNPYEIYASYLNKNIKLFLRNKSVLFGFIIDELRENMEIKAWKFVSNQNAIEFQSTNNEDLVQIISHDDIERIENINL